MGLTEDIFFPNSLVDEAAKRFVILGEFGLIAPVEKQKQWKNKSNVFK